MGYVGIVLAMTDVQFLHWLPLFRAHVGQSI